MPMKEIGLQASPLFEVLIYSNTPKRSNALEIEEI